MRWHTTAALAVLLVALGAFYYVYEIRMGPDREKAVQQKDRVFSADLAEVQGVTLVRPDGTVKLEREGDGWAMLEPLRARGNRGAVEDVLTDVTTAKIDREIAAAPTSLADFGLDKPAAEVTLQLKGDRQLGLVLGGKSPTGVWVYARDRDKPAVFVVGDSVLRAATRPVADFRDKTVLAFDRKDVAGVDIVTPQETIAVAAADGKWRLTKPVALPADTNTITDLLDKLQAATVKEFVAESPKSLAPFGLDRPVRLVIQTGRDKDRATKTLLLGRVDTAKKGLYALREGESSVLLLPEDVWTALPKNVAAIRDKVLVAFERDKLTKLEIASPRGEVGLVRENERWKITAPEALPADESAVGGVLFRLRDLRAQAFLGEDASTIARYLANPQVKVTLTEQGAAAPITVLLAPAPDKRLGQPTAYAAVAGRGPVVLVDAQALGEVGRSLTDLRDRTLLPGLETKDVKRMQVTASGKAVVLERSGSTDWKVVEPKKGTAANAKVEDLLYTVRSLKWKDLVTPGDADVAKYGLDAPAMQILLFRADGKEMGAILVGRREGDRYYVKTKEAPAVYSVEARQLGELPRVEDFQS